MVMKNGEQPITPIYGADKRLYKSSGVDADYFKQVPSLTGLTKREYFAAMAMQGLISNPNIKRPSLDNIPERDTFSRICLEYADSLLKQLES